MTDRGSRVKPHYNLAEGLRADDLLLSRWGRDGCDDLAQSFLDREMARVIRKEIHAALRKKAEDYLEAQRSSGTE